jgi:hypothetical protein
MGQSPSLIVMNSKRGENRKLGQPTEVHSGYTSACSRASARLTLYGLTNCPEH